MLRKVQIRAVVRMRTGQGGGCRKESVLSVRGTEGLGNLLYLRIDAVLEKRKCGRKKDFWCDVACGESSKIGDLRV
jgi:hypothetical protein